MVTKRKGGRVTARRATVCRSEGARDAGDEFAALVHGHQDRVAALAYRLLGWREDVADVVQEVFVAALRYGSRFRGEAQVTTWLYRITVSACRRHRLRQRFRFWRGPRRDPPPGPAQASADQEQCERVRAAVRTLPPALREVVVLRYLEELPIADIAGILALSREAVEARLSRARARLRKELGDLSDATHERE